MPRPQHCQSQQHRLRSNGSLLTAANPTLWQGRACWSCHYMHFMTPHEVIWPILVAQAAFLSPFEPIPMSRCLYLLLLLLL